MEVVAEEILTVCQFELNRCLRIREDDNFNLARGCPLLRGGLLFFGLNLTSELDDLLVKLANLQRARGTTSGVVNFRRQRETHTLHILTPVFDVGLQELGHLRRSDVLPSQSLRIL